MTEPNKPIHVEIRVDGRTISQCLASEYSGIENREGITFSAQRWLPSLPVPDNPLFGQLDGLNPDDLVPEMYHLPRKESDQ